MGNILSLLDLYSETKKEILENISFEPKVLILYGSYAMQDLNKKPESFPVLNGKNGFLDKRPDYIMIVPSLEDSIDKLAKHYSWKQKDINRLKKMKQDAPMIFNLNTIEEHNMQGLGNSKIPYKLFIAPQEYFNKSSETRDNNLFLSSRLSKFFNLCYSEQGFLPDFELRVGLIQMNFTDMALRTLPQEITGEDFIKRYLQVTYFAEAYRVFDLKHKKHLKIYESTVHDFSENKRIPTKEKMVSILKNTLESKTYPIETKEDFLSSTFSNVFTKEKNELFMEFLGYNLNSLKIVLSRLLVTNSIGGDNNLTYLLRKFRRS